MKSNSKNPHNSSSRKILNLGLLSTLALRTAALTLSPETAVTIRSADSTILFIPQFVSPSYFPDRLSEFKPTLTLDSTAAPHNGFVVVGKVPGQQVPDLDGPAAFVSTACSARPGLARKYQGLQSAPAADPAAPSGLPGVSCIAGQLTCSVRYTAVP
jgi:hypothetical protein